MALKEVMEGKDEEDKRFIGEVYRQRDILCGR